MENKKDEKINSEKTSIDLAQENESVNSLGQTLENLPDQNSKKSKDQFDILNWINPKSL